MLEETDQPATRGVNNACANSSGARKIAAERALSQPG
jgi:hypothetical protein